MKSKIYIKWLRDENDCEDCGYSDAYGAEITIGTEVYVLKPVAHCFDSSSWGPEEVLRFILEKLGYSLEEDCTYD